MLRQYYLILGNNNSQTGDCRCYSC
jgi:hypothetical protein